METALPISLVPAQATGKRFGIRAGAYIIDSVILFLATMTVTLVVSLPIGLIVGLAMAMTGRVYTIEEQPNQCLNIIARIVIYIVYFTVFEWLYGATPGKLILGMRVVKEDGTPCDLKTAFIRALLRFIDGFFFGLPAYATMKEPLYQRIGDKSAKTIVVGSNDAIIQKPRLWWWFLIAAGVYLVFDGIVQIFWIVNMIR